MSGRLAITSTTGPAIQSGLSLFHVQLRFGEANTQCLRDTFSTFQLGRNSLDEVFRHASFDTINIQTQEISAILERRHVVKAAAAAAAA